LSAAIDLLNRPPCPALAVYKTASYYISLIRRRALGAKSSVQYNKLVMHQKLADNHRRNFHQYRGTAIPHFSARMYHSDHL